MRPASHSVFDKILAWEDNKLSEAEMIALFQALVDSGDIWRLPDAYQDNAALLYHYGRITMPVAKTLN